MVFVCASGWCSELGLLWEFLGLLLNRFSHHLSYSPEQDGSSVSVRFLMVYVTLHVDCSLQQFCDTFVQNYPVCCRPFFFSLKWTGLLASFINNTLFLASKLVCARCSSCQLALWFSTDLLLLWTSLWILGKRFIRKIWIFFHAVSFSLSVRHLVGFSDAPVYFAYRRNDTFCSGSQRTLDTDALLHVQEYRGSNTSCSALQLPPYFAPHRNWSCTVLRGWSISLVVK